MHRFQDYYGDYYGEDAPCDPYYEDCAATEEPMQDDKMMEEEESTSASPLVLLWGLVPALDIVAGIYTYSDFAPEDGEEETNEVLGECWACIMRE